MVETPVLVQSNWQKYIETEGLLPILAFWSILKKESKYWKDFVSFIDVGLHFDLCENNSYSTFVAKAGFFTRKNLSKKLQLFYKLKICDKVL